jgi:hypothetical protein
MNTSGGKTFTCCGKPFIYYPEVDKLESPPEDKRMKILHACDRLFAARINLTMYYVKNKETTIQFQETPQTS